MKINRQSAAADARPLRLTCVNADSSRALRIASISSMGTELQFVVRPKAAPPMAPAPAALPQSGEPIRIRTAYVDPPPSFTVKARAPEPVAVGYTPPDRTGLPRPGVTKAGRVRVQEQGIKNPERPGRPSDFNWNWAGKFLDAVRAGIFLATAARLTGKKPDTVTHWLYIGRKSERGVLAEFARRVAQAEAEFEAQATQYVTQAARINPDLALKYLRIRHPERYAERQSVTLRPGRPDARQSDDESGPQTLQDAEEALGALSTDGIVTLYEKAFGEFSAEEQDGMVGLDQEA
jgi:hypothetical protein